MKQILILLCGLTTTIHGAEMVVEGVVTLPAPKAASAQVRYQQPSGTVATPEPPAAIVYLEGDFPAAAAGTLANETVWQKGYQFSPALLAIRKGTTVIFSNVDDDYHHVFSYSKAKEFDLGRYRKDEAPPKVLFDKVGLIRVGCEIHDHMRSIILVLDTPHFTKTDPAGKYRLAIGAPLSGSYVIKAWISDKDIREQKIELKAGAGLKLDFPLK